MLNEQSFKGMAGWNKKVPSLEVDCPKKGLGVNSLKTTASESVASEQTADIKPHIMGTA